MKSQFVQFAVLCLMLPVGVAYTTSCMGAEEAATPYPKMFPLDRYLMSDRGAEIALARSAAPRSIAQDAEVMVLARHGYETAAKGTNGFVCLVQRSWMNEADDPGFWNPSLRAPICLNAPAVRGYLPIIIKRTDLILNGRSKAELVAGIGAALDSKELPPLEVGAMCYMMAKQGYLGDRDGHWHPHLMFFVPLTAPASWGAGLPDSPIFAGEDKEDRLTIFMVPVARLPGGPMVPLMRAVDTDRSGGSSMVGAGQPVPVRLSPSINKSMTRRALASQLASGF